MPKRFLYLGAGVAAIAILYSVHETLSHARQENNSYGLTPNSLSGEAMNLCYPSTFFPPEEVWYLDFEGGRYYEAIARPRQKTSNEYQSLYIQTQGDTCKWLNRNDLASGRLRFMPEPVAVALAKQSYAAYLSQCEQMSRPNQDVQTACIQELEATINVPTNWGAQKIDYLFPDDAKALNELGVRTDKVLVVESIRDLEERRKLQIQ